VKARLRCELPAGQSIVHRLHTPKIKRAAVQIREGEAAAQASVAQRWQPASARAQIRHRAQDVGKAGGRAHAHVVAQTAALVRVAGALPAQGEDRKSTRLNSSHDQISYAVF